jgi:hypothetical protein
MRNFAEDVPFELARSAHRGTSFVPEDRASQERSGYASTLAADLANLERYATTDEKRATLAEMFAIYHDGYRKRTLRQLAAKSRCVSTMIAGPSNFNTRRHAKSGAVADRCTSDLIEYRERMITKIRKTLTGHVAIMGGDSDAVTKLREKLVKLESVQSTMKACNAAIRKHAGSGAEAQIAALIALNMHPAHAADLIKPDYCGRIGFADYQIKNNGAEIRRLKARIGTVASAKDAPMEHADGEHAKLEDCPADNRIRLFFPGKPSSDVRDTLKAAGFRWAPTIGCWQAYRNHHSITTARAVAGVTS